MKRLRNLIFYSVMACILSEALYAVVPSSRPGMGAIPYSGGTTFRVWAPNAATVTAAGTFNGWNTTSKPLAAEPNGLWSADITGVYASQEYKYVINGSIWRTDPRARDVVNSVGNGIIVSNAYTWTSFTPPAWNEMIIYEMHIGTYNDTPGGSPGTWQSAIAKLDHIQSLGVNAVEILPIAEFPADYSMGYNPVNLFAPESAYGSPNDLRNFIEQCHQRGIAVLIDVVYNHLGPTDLDQSLWKFDGYSTYDYTGGIYFFEDDNRYTPWGDTRPNYTTGQVRSFIRDNVMYWLNEYNMDGIRMDGTAYVRQRDTTTGPVDVPGGWSLMQWINNDNDAAHSQKILIAEDMRDNDWITKTTGEGGAGFDSQWDAGFHHKVVAALAASSDSDRNMLDIRDAVSHLYNGWDTQRVVYTESHDEVGASSGKSRVPEQIWPGSAGSYYSKKRSTLGAGLVFTSPGIPMIFMGQEFLEDGSWQDSDPLDWSKNTTYAGIKLLYTHLIGLRRNLSGHTRGLLGKNVNVFHVNNTSKVIAFHRWWSGGPGDDVIVVANFSNQELTGYNIGMPRGGRWRVRFNSDWNGYDSGFNNWNAYDANAQLGSKDGLNYNANVGIGPYTIIILSQGTDPNLDGIGKVDLKDFALFAGQWQQDCDNWDSCGGADFDMSGKVDMADLTTFISRWLDDAEGL
jgi:1,4-alpha-glucan branching enzyme